VSEPLHTPDAGEYHATQVVTVVASFLTPFMGSAVNIALPSIGAEFKMDAIALSWVATAFFITAAVFLVPFGKWADLYGRRRVFLRGMVIVALASLGLTLCPSSWMLIVLRAIQGIGSSMIFATSMAILTAATPPQQRGRMLGINVASVYLGLSMGPFLGGILTHQFGWRSIFLMNFLISIGACSLVAWKVHNDVPKTTGAQFDLAGSILYSTSFVALMLGMSRMTTWNGGIMVVGGALLLGLFLTWESRISNPVLDLHLFRNNTVYAMSNLAALINYSATAAITFLLSLHLQNIMGLTAQHAGLVLVMQPIVMTLLSPLAGTASDRREPRHVASLGMGFTAAGLALFALRGNALTTGFILLDLVILGIGFALFSSPNTNAVMSSVGKEWYGIASATLGTMRLTGQMFSMGIVMLIFAVNMKSAVPPASQAPAFISSMRLAFCVFSLLCCAGIFASLARGNLRKAHQQP
jgi:EmrB/QacA subfamily drug resistance transporter